MFDYARPRPGRWAVGAHRASTGVGGTHPFHLPPRPASVADYAWAWIAERGPVGCCSGRGKGRIRGDDHRCRFEWVGSHASGLAKAGRHVASAPPYETWYDQMFPGFKECAFVSGSRLDEPQLALLRTVSHYELGFATSENLYVYAVRGEVCPARPLGL